MISKICRWRLHNPLAVLIIERMRRILKCTSKLFHAHFTSVMREPPANFWVLNSITRLIQSREHECRAGRSSYFFFFRGARTARSEHWEHSVCRAFCFCFFIYEHDYRALEIRHPLITCRIRDKQRFGKLRHTFSAKTLQHELFCVVSACITTRSLL